MGVSTLLGTAAGRARGTVLHVSPHPDDELVGAPGTLKTLRDHGWQIVNLAGGLGRPGRRGSR